MTARPLTPSDYAEAIPVLAGVVHQISLLQWGVGGGEHPLSRWSEAVADPLRAELLRLCREYAALDLDATDAFGRDLALSTANAHCSNSAGFTVQVTLDREAALWRRRL